MMYLSLYRTSLGRALGWHVRAAACALLLAGFMACGAQPQSAPPAPTATASTPTVSEAHVQPTSTVLTANSALLALTALPDTLPAERAPSDSLRHQPTTVTTSDHTALIGAVGGRAAWWPVTRTIAYLVDDNGATVFDLRDPRHPARLAHVVLPWGADNLQVIGQRGYLTSGKRGFQVLDMRDPTAPALIGSLDSLDARGQASALQVVGTRAYVAHVDGPLQIIDLGDPVHPTLLGSLWLPQRATAVSVTGDYAYMPAGEQGLYIVDVSNPAAPTLFAHDTQAERVWAVQAVDTRLYLVTNDALQILDIHDPAAPRLLGSYQPAAFLDLQVVGTMLYATRVFGGIDIIDVGDPAAPRLNGHIDAPILMSPMEHRARIMGSLAFIACTSATNDNNLQIFDVSNPALPVLANTIALARWPAFGVQVVGTTTYVAAGEQGLQIVDLRQPNTPIILGSFDTPGNANRVQVRGSVAYVADRWSGVQILDVSNPANPTLIATIAGGEVFDVQVVGATLYVVDFGGKVMEGGLQIFDVRDPTHPVPLGHYEASGSFAVCVVDQRAYLAVANAGLHILDIGDPSRIIAVGVYQMDSAAREVDVVGSRAYIATEAPESAGVQIVDVRDPARPTLLGRYETPSRAMDVQVVDNTAYLATEYSGVYVLDVHNPAAPRLRTHYDVEGAYTVQLVGDRLYVAANGLQIFAQGGGPVPTPVAVTPATRGAAGTAADRAIRVSREH